jgi:AcrR family transcriptional regulator
MEAGMDKSRQERILQAAEEVFSRRGYIEATLDEIIKVADTGKGTVYKYFGNKENLFYTLVESKHNILMQEFWKIAQSTADVESKIHAYLEDLDAFFNDQHGAVAGHDVRDDRW